MMRAISLFAVVILLLTLTTACVDRGQLKIDVLQALQQYKDMKNYRFQGSASIHADTVRGLLQQANPLTAGLLNLILTSDISWQGVSSVHPVRAEAVFLIQPHDKDVTYEVPLLIKDNKLMIHIPTLHQAEQFFEIDLAEVSRLSQTADNPGLQAAGDLFAQVAEQFIQQVSAKQFDEEDSKHNAQFRTITAAYTAKQTKPAVEAWFQVMPGVIRLLDDAGWITDHQSASAQQLWNDEKKMAWLNRINDITIHEPSGFAFDIDEEGFIRRIRAETHFTIADHPNAPRSFQLSVDQQLDAINANPEFTMPDPEQLIPLSDLLKLIAGQAQ